ncbi:MAG TPA: SH3 domain-containing protein [Chloroflexota bacterium]|nr:SH3 domain-containing protein [Chloroflexota bacterium]
MAASHFFVGLGAGMALLTIPTVLLVPQLDVPQRIASWITGPPPEAARSSSGDLVALGRPQRGYIQGRPTPTPEPPPTIVPVARPTLGPALGNRPPAAVTADVAPTPPAGALQTGVVRSGGAGVYVRRVAGVQSPGDAFLPDGSPVLIAGSSEVQVSGQAWRSVRGLNGVAGWVPSSMIAVDGPRTASAAPAGQRAVVGNTGGVGVVLRASPRADDRLPSGLLDGVVVAIIERRGTDWARVRADTGQEGWVPAQYLIPTN